MLLPASRTVTKDEKKKQILLYREAGLSIIQIIQVMELEKNVAHGQLSFIDKDIHNLFVRVKRMLGDDDVKNLLLYMQYAKEHNNLFQYAYTMDDDRRLEHKTHQNTI